MGISADAEPAPEEPTGPEVMVVAEESTLAEESFSDFVRKWADNYFAWKTQPRKAKFEKCWKQSSEAAMNLRNPKIKSRCRQNIAESSSSETSCHN